VVALRAARAVEPKKRENQEPQPTEEEAKAVIWPKSEPLPSELKVDNPKTTQCLCPTGELGLRVRKMGRYTIDFSIYKKEEPKLLRFSPWQYHNLNKLIDKMKGMQNDQEDDQI
jgi:hypothetical protein